MRSLFVLGFLLVQVIVAAVVLWPRRGAFRRAGREWWSDWRAAVGAEPTAAKVAVIAMAFVGFAVRVYYVTCPMRGDEAQTYFDFVRESWWTALSFYSAPNNHILNSLLAKVAVTAFGPTVWALRLPALVAGVALIPAGYAFARAQYSTPAALVAAALLTASSPLIVYSVNGRGYTLLCLAFLLSVPIGAYAVRTNNVAAWGVLAATNALGFFAVPVMVYPFGATMIWLFIAAWHRRDIMLSIVAAGLATLVMVADLYAPVAINVGYRAVIHNPAIASQPWAFFWKAMPSFLDLWFRDMSDGLPLVVLVILGVAIITALIVNRRLSPWSVPLLVPSVLWSIALTLVSHRVPYTRIYIFVAIVALTTAAAGIAGWWRVADRWSSIGAVAGAIALVAAFMSSPAMAHSLEFVDSSPIAAALRTQLRPGDGVITPWWTSETLHYYLERDNSLGRDHAYIPPLNRPPWDSTDTPHLEPPMARRLIVITPRVGEQSLDSLLTVMGVDPRSFSPPAAPLRFPTNAVYVVTRLY